MPVHTQFLAIVCLIKKQRFHQVGCVPFFSPLAGHHQSLSKSTIIALSHSLQQLCNILDIMFITYLSFLIYIHCNPNISVTITKLNKHFYTCLFTCGIFVSSFATQPWRARGIYFQCMTPHFSSWSQSHQIEIVSVFKHQGYKCACLCMIFTFSIQAT